MIKIESNTRTLEMALERLAQSVKVDQGKVIKQESGNVCKILMMIIPPTTNQNKGPNPSGNPSRRGLSPQARKQGQNAILTDLVLGGNKTISKSYKTIGLFQEIGASKLNPPRNNSTETLSVNLGWEQSKNVRIMRRFWKPSASIEEMRAFHKQFQNKRGRTGVVSRSTIGRQKVQDQMWVRGANLNAYLRLLYDRVGWHKAGFAIGASKCGIRVPAWIKRHEARAGDAYLNVGGEQSYFRATAKGIKMPINDINRMMQGALRLRTKITLDKLKRVVERKAVNLGFAKVSNTGKVEMNDEP